MSDVAFTNDQMLDDVAVDENKWTLTHNRFEVYRFQIQTYGTGFEIDSMGGEYDSSETEEEPTNRWPLFSPRFTGAFIAGFWDLQPNTTKTNFPELLKNGGESVISTVPQWTTFLVESLSFKNGIVQTKLNWLPNGNETTALSLDYTVLAHRVIPTLGMVKTIFLESNSSSHDETGIWTGVRFYGLRNVTAYEYSHLKFSDRNAVNISSPATISQEFEIYLTAGKTFTVYKYVGVASSDAYHNAKRADIEFLGDPELQVSIHTTIFHLLAALRSGDEPLGRGDTSIAVSGLSSDSYAGQIFWDADTWIYPGLSVLHPKHAFNINIYRRRLHGQSYSWTSGRFENCTGTGPCVDYQYHLNIEIAQAHWNQYLLTNDTTWLKKKWMANPDEYANFVNNGAFTNADISKLMGWATRAADILDEEVGENWKGIEENIYIPIDDEIDLILEFPKMNGTVKIKQADVVLLNYPLEYDSYDVNLNNLDFYANAQSADGPAMTWAIFAINAAQLSPKGCASYTYLLYSSQPYLRSPFFQFSEQIDDNVLTHGFTGFRPREDVFYLDPVLPPQIEDEYTVKGLKWRDNVFDIIITLTETTIERKYATGLKTPRLRRCRFENRPSILSSFLKPVTVRIGSGKKKGDYELEIGESLKVPTRRADLNGTLIDGNIAQCSPVLSNTTWVKGHFPISAVDGSNSTYWQPDTRDPAALFVDLGRFRNVSKINLNWGRTPAKMLSFGYFNDELKWLIQNYNALKVKLNIGNTTEVSLNNTISSR
ncbi:Six-hairpin glycosidase-like protein [Lipomyces japonicus]|uniref:Six-hairpin glycosidase-like protein n=1 Tax=Lipomyces japonicus TaxID=56871 RepID=UPI0034CEEA83